MFTGRAKELKAGTTVTARYDWNPSGVLIDKLISKKKQTITMYPAVPLWLMSPGIRVYRKKDIIQFEGYVKTVTLLPPTEVEFPGAVMTILPAENNQC